MLPFTCQFLLSTRQLEQLKPDTASGPAGCRMRRWHWSLRVVPHRQKSVVGPWPNSPATRFLPPLRHTTPVTPANTSSKDVQSDNKRCSVFYKGAMRNLKRDNAHQLYQRRIDARQQLDESHCKQTRQTRYALVRVNPTMQPGSGARAVSTPENCRPSGDVGPVSISLDHTFLYYTFRAYYKVNSFNIPQFRRSMKKPSGP